MIIKQINKNNFIDAFRGSETYKDNFTYEGLQALYTYIDDLSDDIGENIELDIIALCCDYSQFDSAMEAMEQYQPEDMPTVDEEGLDLVELAEKQETLALEWLQDRTTVIQFNEGIIIQNF